MTPQAPKGPPHALEYSTPSIEGLPRFHPEAEAKIYLGEPPDALLKVFEKPLDAVRYYGMSMSRRFDARRLEDLCVVCHGPAAERMVRVGWRARVRVTGPARVAAGIWERDRNCDFFTMHAICVPCYRRWRGRIRRVSFAVVGVCILTLGAMAGLSLRSTLRGMPAEAAVLSLLGMTFVVGVVAAAILQKVAWRRPHAFDRIMPAEVTATGDIELLRRPAAVRVEPGEGP